MITILDILGNYTIQGKNQNEDATSYTGSLHLGLNEDGRIIGSWLINNEQKQHGIGYFKNGLLVLNFSYNDEDNQTYHGVVIYKITTNFGLNGFWYEEYGNPKFLGEEKAIKIPTNTLLN